MILPCGGQGARLALPYPKELHVVRPGVPLIDLSLNLLEHLTARPHLLIVTTLQKPELINYLSKRCADFQVSFVIQRTPGFMGALHDAKPHVKETNLVLLPDQAIIADVQIEALFTGLERGHPTAVLAHKRADSSSLADEGAIALLNGHIHKMAEKPSASCVDYNAAWCGLGFRREAADALLRDLNSLYRDGSLSASTDSSSSLFTAPVFCVDDYTDLGTWDRLLKYQRDYNA